VFTTCYHVARTIFREHVGNIQGPDPGPVNIQGTFQNVQETFGKVWETAEPPSGSISQLTCSVAAALSTEKASCPSKTFG
jgi:hypothetical protein